MFVVPDSSEYETRPGSDRGSNFSYMYPCGGRGAGGRVVDVTFEANITKQQTLRFVVKKYLKSNKYVLL